MLQIKGLWGKNRGPQPYARADWKPDNPSWICVQWFPPWCSLASHLAITGSTPWIWAFLHFLFATSPGFILTAIPCTWHIQQCQDNRGGGGQCSVPVKMQREQNSSHVHLDTCHIWHAWVQNKMPGQRNCAVESVSPKAWQSGGTGHATII